MLVKTYGSAVSGIDAKTITIEVDITRGIKYQGHYWIELICM